MVRPVQISGQKPVIYIYDYTYNSCLKSTFTTVTTFSFYCSEKDNFPQKLCKYTILSDVSMTAYLDDDNDDRDS